MKIFVGMLIGFFATVLLFTNTGWESKASELKTACENPLPRGKHCEVSMVANPK